MKTEAAITSITTSVAPQARPIGTGVEGLPSDLLCLLFSFDHTVSLSRRGGRAKYTLAPLDICFPRKAHMVDSAASSIG